MWREFACTGEARGALTVMIACDVGLFFDEQPGQISSLPGVNETEISLTFPRPSWGVALRPSRNADPCPMKRARLASERDHRLMDDDQWDDFWYNLDARYQDLEHQPVPAPTKPQMTFSQEFHLAAEAKAREDAAALARSRTHPKSHRCGTCTACRASDCGRCKNCRDKPRCAFLVTSPQAAPRLARGRAEPPRRLPEASARTIC